MIARAQSAHSPMAAADGTIESAKAKIQDKEGVQHGPLPAAVSESDPGASASTELPGIFDADGKTSRRGWTVDADIQARLDIACRPLLQRWAQPQAPVAAVRPQADPGVQCVGSPWAQPWSAEQQQAFEESLQRRSSAALPTAQSAHSSEHFDASQMRGLDLMSNDMSPTMPNLPIPTWKRLHYQLPNLPDLPIPATSRWTAPDNVDANYANAKFNADDANEMSPLGSLSPQ